MYRIKATAAARKRAKALARTTGLQQSHILLESKSSADNQVGVGDVNQWYANKRRWERRNRAKRGDQHVLRIPQYGGTANNRYPAVEAWGRYVKSAPAYIALQVVTAQRDGAPPLAAYKLRGRWVELSEVRMPPAVFYFREYYPDLAEQAWGKEE